MGLWQCFFGQWPLFDMTNPAIIFGDVEVHVRSGVGFSTWRPLPTNWLGCLKGWAGRGDKSQAVGNGFELGLCDVARLTNSSEPPPDDHPITVVFLHASWFIDRDTLTVMPKLATMVAMLSWIYLVLTSFSRLQAVGQDQWKLETWPLSVAEQTYSLF